MKYLITKLVNDKFRYYLRINVKPAQHHNAKLIWYGVEDNATRFKSDEDALEAVRTYKVDLENDNIEIETVKV